MTPADAVGPGVAGWICLYGQDFIFTQSAGLETKSNTANSWNGSKMFGLAVPQIYGEVAYNNLSVKLGHFYAIMGYKTVPANGNFFYSHAYTMQYPVPFTHTGGLATYDFNEPAMSSLRAGMIGHRLRGAAFLVVPID